MWWDVRQGDALARRAQEWLASHGQSALCVVDSHTAGNPTRIIVGGLKVPESVRTVPQAREWLRTEVDWARRRLNHEPRGGALTCSVLPLPASDDSHDLGAVILEPGSYPPMCGHCMIGLATVVHELDLFSGHPAEGGGTRYRIRTPAGVVGAVVRDGSPTTVALENVDSYVVDSWTEVLGGRQVTCTLLYGGDYYPTIDAAELGLLLDRAHTDDIVRYARELTEKVRRRDIVDPVTGAPADVYQVMFHQSSAPRTAVTAVVAPPGVIDRSPCGTGSSALLALKVANGEIRADEQLRTNSVIGSEFRVRTAAVRMVEGRQIVKPVVIGSAHINGFATIVADPADALADGFAPL